MTDTEKKPHKVSICHGMNHSSDAIFVAVCDDCPWKSTKYKIELAVLVDAKIHSELSARSMSSSDIAGSLRAPHLDKLPEDERMSYVCNTIVEHSETVELLVVGFRVENETDGFFLAHSEDLPGVVIQMEELLDRFKTRTKQYLDTAKLKEVKSPIGYG